MDEKLKMLWDSEDEVNWLLVSVIFGEEKLLEYILDVYNEARKNVGVVKCGWFKFETKFKDINNFHMETYSIIRTSNGEVWSDRYGSIWSGSGYITYWYKQIIKTKQE